MAKTPLHELIEKKICAAQEPNCTNDVELYCDTGGGVNPLCSVHVASDIHTHHIVFDEGQPLKCTDQHIQIVLAMYKRANV